MNIITNYNSSVKNNYPFSKLCLLILLFCSIIINKSKANCDIDEWTSLRALYLSTNLADLNLPGWNILENTNPPANCDFNNLYGIVAGTPPIQGFPEGDDVILEIDLNNESISGSLPEEIGNLSFLTKLNLSHNQISGSIPLTFVSFSILNVLDLSHNQLSGGIPLGIWNLGFLFELDLSFNQLSGSLPTGIPTLSNLNQISLNNNNLNGCFDQSLTQFCNFTVVEVDAGNNFDVTWEDFCTNGAGVCMEFDLNVKLLLEEAYVVEEDQHINDLWFRGLLPGMAPINSTVTPTPKGQPYNTAPWNYKGEEGLSFSDNNYSYLDVDWVLVSLRTGTTKNTEIFRAAGIIDVNGDIRFTTTNYLSNIIDPLYIVVEHRNYLPVMSHTPVSFVGNTLTYDFSAQDSFRTPSKYGQIQLSNGKWAALAGNGDQAGNSNERDDINGGDKAKWTLLNGFHDLYSDADYNLDADINGYDKAIWRRNNGKACIVNQ